jgi:hypothetical protein
MGKFKFVLLKEKLFLQKVLALEDEERKNQLKWQVKLGENSIDYHAKQDIILCRTQAEQRYKVNRSFRQLKTKDPLYCTNWFVLKIRLVLENRSGF